MEEGKNLIYRTNYLKCTEITDSTISGVEIMENTGYICLKNGDQKCGEFKVNSKWQIVETGVELAKQKMIRHLHIINIVNF